MVGTVVGVVCVGGGVVIGDVEQIRPSSITVGQAHLYPEGIVRQRCVQPPLVLRQGCFAKEGKKYLCLSKSIMYV